MVERLFLAVPRGCLQFVIVVFPDHTHLLFLRGRTSAEDKNACSMQELTCLCLRRRNIILSYVTKVILQSRFSFENVKILLETRDVKGVISKRYQNM